MKPAQIVAVVNEITLVATIGGAPRYVEVTAETPLAGVTWRCYREDAPQIGQTVVCTITSPEREA